MEEGGHVTVAGHVMYGTHGYGRVLRGGLRLAHGHQRPLPRALPVRGPHQSQSLAAAARARCPIGIIIGIIIGVSALSIAQ